MVEPSSAFCFYVHGYSLWALPGMPKTLRASIAAGYSALRGQIQGFTIYLSCSEAKPIWVLRPLLFPIFGMNGGKPLPMALLVYLPLLRKHTEAA